MEDTLKQILQELVDTSMELANVREQLRLLQTECTDLKNKDSRSGADKGV